MFSQLGECKHLYGGCSDCEKAVRNDFAADLREKIADLRTRGFLVALPDELMDMLDMEPSRERMGELCEGCGGSINPDYGKCQRCGR